MEAGASQQTFHPCLCLRDSTDSRRIAGGRHLRVPSAFVQLMPVQTGKNDASNDACIIASSRCKANASAASRKWWLYATLHAETWLTTILSE
jgi:hypothetical protein